MIQCPECGVWPCVVSCKENALSFFYGGLIVQTAKCAACPDFLEDAIPRCVADCAKSAVKRLVEEESVEEKRKNAAAALC